MNIRKNPYLVILIFLAATVFLISMACGGSATPEKVGQVENQAPPEPQPTVPPPTEPAADPAAENSADPAKPAENSASAGPAAYAVGDIVTIGDNILVILGWEDVPGDDFSQPDDGQKFVAVEMIIVNQSEDAISVSTMLQMTLKDETGQNYPVDFLASMAIDETSVDGELAPGERIRGKVGFQVPVEARGLQFVFDESLFGSGKSFINLGTAPVSLEPPAEIAGERQQQTFQVGDIVDIGDFSLTVNEVFFPAGDDFNQPKAGHQFVAVDVTFENKSAESAGISSMLQMSLKVATGQSYQVDLSASTAAGGSTPDGELVPGEKIRGQVGYQIPVDATDPVFVFDADIFGAGKVFVALP